MELASLLKVTFGLVLLVSQSLTQQALQRDVGTLLEELVHLIMLQNTIPPWSVTGSSSVLLLTTPHVLSVPISVHMPL